MSPSKRPRFGVRPPAPRHLPAVLQGICPGFTCDEEEVADADLGLRSVTREFYDPFRINAPRSLMTSWRMQSRPACWSISGRSALMTPWRPIWTTGPTPRRIR